MRASVSSWMAHLSILLLVSLVLATAGVPLAAGSISVEHEASIPCRDPVTGFAFSPLGLCFGLLGELYVVDSDNSRIFIVSESFEKLEVFTEAPDGFPDCQFIDLERNEVGGLYVTERSSGAVLALDRWGNLATQCEVGEGLAGIGVGSAGQVYAALSFTGTIRIVDFNTRADPIESLNLEEGENSYPVDCLVSGADEALVTDASAGKVHVLDLMGGVRDVLGGFEFGSPFGLAGWGDRYVLVSDMDLGMIAVFDPKGKFVGSFGDEFLDSPTFVDVRDDGTVCVADADKMTIEVFRFVRP